MKKLYVMTVMILVAVSMLLGCTETQATETTFHVTSGSNNLADIIILVDGVALPAATDANGLVSVLLSNGPHTYAVTDAGYLPVAVTPFAVPYGGEVAVPLSNPSSK